MGEEKVMAKKFKSIRKLEFQRILVGKFSKNFSTLLNLSNKAFY
jgi:hypothetical protein